MGARKGRWGGDGVGEDIAGLSHTFVSLSLLAPLFRLLNF